MRKILLLLMMTSFCFGQHIEMRLTNANVGTPLNSNTLSNSTALNAILQANNVLTYEMKYGHPNMDYYNKIVEANCNNCNTSEFISQLLSSGIVEFAQPYSPMYLGDALYLKIVNPNVGTLTGTSNGIITTNDAGLNQIFQDFNVSYYQQFAPSASDAEILKVHFLSCNCNNIGLKNALDAYATVIESTDFIGRAILLNTPDFKLDNTKVYPNPFQDYFEIESDQTILSYKIVDLSGKLYTETSNKDVLKMQTSALSTGIYFLKLEYEDGKLITKKIAKK